MFRYRAAWFLIGLFALTALACNAFAGGSVEPTLVPPAEATRDVVDGLLTPTATVSPESTAEPLASVLVDLNIRSGPGVEYDRVGFLLEGDSAPIIGAAPDNDWWKIACPPDVEGDECWISGGAEFSRAGAAEGVPIVEVPPTPTPLLPELSPGQGIVTYVDEGQLLAARLDLSQNPPELVGEPERLVDEANVQEVLIAPNGLRVAYITGSADRNSLNVVNINGEDRRTLVRSDELPVVAESGVELATVIGQVQWLEGAQTLAFNTNIVNPAGPGVQSREDLWTITLDGELTERFSAGLGGGAFLVRPNRQVILSRADNIARINLDGSAGEVLITYPLINTASEYVYYPEPQWTPDDGVYMAVPDADPWEAGTGAGLWQILESGPAVPLGRVEGNILFNPVIWSPNGARLSYVQYLTDGGGPQSLIVASGDGSSPDTYVEDDRLVLFGWSPNGRRFLFATDEEYATGAIGASPEPVRLAEGEEIAGAAWLNDLSYVAVTGFPENNRWGLSGVTLSGQRQPLLAINSDIDVIFDVWAPVDE